MPLACGMPPIPAGCSITRLLSVIANWPSRKKPSRGVVAIQLGLPRPALRKADCVVLRRLLGEVDQLVLDLEWAQSFELAQRQNVSHDLLLLFDSRGRLSQGRAGEHGLSVRAHDFRA